MRSRKIRDELERRIRDALRTRDMDTNEICRVTGGKRRTVQMILSGWHRNGVVFYDSVTGKHTLRPTLSKPYMKDYKKYAEAMGLEFNDLEKWGKWSRTLRPLDKARRAYTELVAWQIAKTSAEMILTIVTSQQQDDDKSREEHLDMMIDIYLRGRLQELRMTGEWNSDVADESFREVLSDYMQRSDQHRESFIQMLGRPLRWRAVRDKVSNYDRTGRLHGVR